MRLFSTDSTDYNSSTPSPVRHLYRDSEPIDEIIADPSTVAPCLNEKGQRLAKKAARVAAAKERRGGQDLRLRDHVKHHLTVYGAAGKPEDGESIRGRGWSSNHPSDELTYLIAGEKEPVDIYEVAEAEEALDYWGQHSVLRSALARTVVSSESYVVSGTDTKEFPAVTPSLMKAIVPIDSVEPVAPKFAITEELVNDCYVAFASDPAEESNFVGALSAFLSTRYLAKVRKVVRSGGYQDPHDVLTDFNIVLIEKIRKGEYQHQGTIQNWIGKVWVGFFADFQEDYFEERNVSVSLNPWDTLDENSDEVAATDGTINPCQVDWESHERMQVGENSPAQRINRVFSKLDDPNEELGQLPDDIKLMLQSLREGLSKTEAAKKAGVNERTARNYFSKIKSMRESSFLNRKAVAA